MRSSFHVAFPCAVDKDTARHEDVRLYYEFGREIGRGGFSVVVEGAKKGTNERYAIKCIKKSNVERDDIKLLRREIQIMKAVDHPNILKVGGIGLASSFFSAPFLQLYEVFETEEEFFLVMELVDGKELFDKIVERGQVTRSARVDHRFHSVCSTRRRTQQTLCARSSVQWSTSTRRALHIGT